VRSAEHDERLAEKIGVRLDVLLRIFRELLSRATGAARTRLLELAAPESRRHIQSVLTAIAEDAQHEARCKKRTRLRRGAGPRRRAENGRAA
jgi:hypothetical protein